MREGIANIVRKARPGEKGSKIYDIFITVVALVSILPLMFKQRNAITYWTDLITVYILFFDYIFRWIAYDYTSGKKAPWAFVLYPFTFFAIVDLLSILPSLGLLGESFRIFRMFRIFIIMHYSKSFIYISNVFKKEKKTLCSVLIIAIAYIYVSALAMFCHEPDTFDSFFEALYWATTALTTVGYGDIFPLSDVGKFISMISSLFGIAVIALPAGIVTSGFMDEINRVKAGEEDEKKKEQNPSGKIRIAEEDKKQ